MERYRLLGHRLYFSGSPALRRSSRKALFIGSLIAQQDSVAIETGAILSQSAMMARASSTRPTRKYITAAKSGAAVSLPLIVSNASSYRPAL